MSEVRTERSEPAKRRASEASLSEPRSEVGARAARANDVLRPVLKWAGGKRQLLPELRPYYPTRFDRYFEPFVGSGAVFMDLHNAGLLDGRAVRLSDINTDIIGCYRMVRDAVDDVIDALRTLDARYRAEGSAAFYAVRDGEFNPARRQVRATADPSPAYTPSLAAMLIFLNRTGYNGLFRLNASGDFNVPAGRHVRPRICDEANLRRLSAAFNRPGVSLEVRAFEDALGDAGAADFVYLDPPYAPLSTTARFTSYTAGGFGTSEQARLQEAVIDLASRGAFVLLSNSSAPEIRRLYASDNARRAGLRAKTVPARRAINSRASSRGPVQEYVITNITR